jgi:phage FluMu protein Com
MSPKEPLLRAIEFTARAEEVKCPHCNEWNGGLLGGPRGKEAECDHCHKVFAVSHNAIARIG